MLYGVPKKTLKQMPKGLLRIPQQLLIKPDSRLKTLEAYPFVNAMKTDRVHHRAEFDDIGGHLAEMS
jgi:hypothetical protein